MSDPVSFILDQQKEKLKNEIADKPMSIIFDGVSRLGECCLRHWLEMVHSTNIN